MNQQYNIKFPNINLLDVMGRVVEKHTKHYQTDFFDVDTELLRVAASKVSCLDRTFLWLCRENGTWLLRERDVFIQGTRESNTFRFYVEQTHEPVLLFAIEVNGISRFDGSVVGNLYPMDYRKLYDHVKAICFRSTSVLMRYEYGEFPCCGKSGASGRSSPRVMLLTIWQICKFHIHTVYKAGANHAPALIF